METQRIKRTQERTEMKNEREEKIKYGSNKTFINLFDPMYGRCTIVELSPLPLLHC